MPMKFVSEEAAMYLKHKIDYIITIVISGPVFCRRSINLLSKLLNNFLVVLVVLSLKKIIRFDLLPKISSQSWRKFDICVLVYYLYTIIKKKR